MKCIFCDNKVHAKYGIYCPNHTSQGQGKRKSIINNKQYTDNDKWVNIGTNSSYEAMKTLYELFKNKN